MWRGPALVDVPTGPQLGVAVARLEQSRLGVLETRIDADLRLGRHRQLLDELAELTTRYPMHEKFCIQYMTALHVCGCKWRALEVFLALRKRLVAELGLEPSLEVKRVQRAILTADVEPDGEAKPNAGSRRAAIPAQFSTL
jgi:DNA-binding SARP family transcriptional activator